MCISINKFFFLLKHNIEVEVARDQISTWHAMVDFEGTTGIWLDGKWNAISDLEKKENVLVRDCCMSLKIEYRICPSLSPD